MKGLFSALVGISLLLFLAGCASNSHTPPPSQYTISGTVADLAAGGVGVVLQDNGADNLTVTGDGNFVFATKIASGGAYNVTVMTQPASPAQQFTVANGSGTATGNVSNIKVECGHGEWAWMTGTQSVNQIGTYGTLGTGAAANTPGGKQFPATWTDSSGNLWLFGGYGYDSNNNLLPMNDLWEYSARQWIWMGGPSLGGQSGNYGSLGVATPFGIPGARFQPASWTDSSGNFWMFGGNGFDSVGNESPMNDVWKYSGGEWTWVGGSSVGKQNGNYGTLGLANASNEPGGRCSMAMWKDSSGNIWVFGGVGYDATNPIIGDLNDLWKYSGGVWTWMGGATVKSQRGVYGTQGVAASANFPGAREAAYNWVDSSGNLWLFGGYGYDVNGTNGYLNDLWKYSGGEWTWMGGSNIVFQPGVYGTKGTASANNIPGARWSGVSWLDSAGNMWLFGGSGVYTTTNAGLLNDLWKYSGGQWTWVSGANTASQNSTGSEGALAPGNTPGSRFFLNGWVDLNGNFWLFGGYGQGQGANGNLNDLWMYMP